MYYCLQGPLDDALGPPSPLVNTWLTGHTVHKRIFLFIMMCVCEWDHIKPLSVHSHILSLWCLFFPFEPFSFSVKNVSRRRSPASQPDDVTCASASAARRELPVRTSCPSSVSSVLTVAAKFHTSALNSTSVALCYLRVISHFHFWLTTKKRKRRRRRKCVWVCVCVL